MLCASQERRDSTEHAAKYTLRRGVLSNIFRLFHLALNLRETAMNDCGHKTKWKLHLPHHDTGKLLPKTLYCEPHWPPKDGNRGDGLLEQKHLLLGSKVNKSEPKLIEIILQKPHYYSANSTSKWGENVSASYEKDTGGKNKKINRYNIPAPPKVIKSSMRI